MATAGRRACCCLTLRTRIGHAPPPGIVHSYSPAEVVEFLRLARSQPKSAMLTGVLECFRVRWLRWARARHPNLAAHHDDAVRNPHCVESWANQVFASVIWEIIKKQRRRALWHVEVRPGHDPDALLHRLPDVRPTTEELASFRERLEIVREVVRTFDVPRLRFVEELSEQEIKERTGRSREAIATFLKRIRTVLRRILDETDEEGRPLPTSKILEKTGLSRDQVAELMQVIDRLLGRLSSNGPPDEDGPNARKN